MMVPDPGDIPWEVAYEAGYARALVLAAERRDELDVIWSPIPRRSYEEQVADRIAEMEAKAITDFPGGLPIPPDYVCDLATYGAELDEIVAEWLRANPSDGRSDYEVAVLLGVGEQRVKAHRGRKGRRAA